MNGIKFWSYNAGHVLGAAMFMLEIAGVKILYTGDFSCEEDRHLMAAEVPSISPDVLISVSFLTLSSYCPSPSLPLPFRSPHLAPISMNPGRPERPVSLVCVCVCVYVCS